MKFKVNHLVTFTSSSSQQQQTYYEAINRLQEVEEVIGVWRQKVFIEFAENKLNILDSNSCEVIEHFPTIAVRKPEAIDYNSVYYNLLIFTVYLSKESAEMHIFDCRSLNAHKIADDMNVWRQKSLDLMPHRMVSTYPVVNYTEKGLKTYSLIDKNKNDSQLLDRRLDLKPKTKVKETVNAFNQIAIQRKRSEKIEKLVNNKTNDENEPQLDSNWEIKPKKLQPFRYF